ncbi:diguanylate cyclase [Pilimelia columellifera]|uniref:Histidine kinase N-terminal 7TM domain-containing protein n=1 Tax=Pilimelia columellifera subsp. columellifera TaxID=706583 RepID=A0ABP6AX01_9ACTN
MSLVASQFALAAVVAGAVSVLCWKRRHLSVSLRVLSFNTAGIVAYAVCELVAVNSRGPVAVQSWKLATIPGLLALVAGLFVLSKAVMDRGWAPSRRLIAALSAMPVLILAAAATNPWHHLFFVSVLPAEPGSMPLVEPGPFFWIHAAYNQILIFVSMWGIAWAWWRSKGTHRRMLGALLIASLAPAGARMFWYTGIHPVDFMALGFTVLAVVAYVAVSRHWIERMPLAHKRVFESVSDAVLVVDTDGRIVDLNESAVELRRRLLPGTVGDPVGTPVGEMLMGLTPRDGMASDRTLADVWGSGVDLHVRVRAIADRRRGSIGWTFVARDITEMNRQRQDLEQANSQLRAQLETIEALRADLAEQAIRDPLTGLHNRRYLMDHLDRVVVGLVGTGLPLSLAILDVDHFKKVNDECGHGAGDAVLVELARLLEEGLGVDDIVARHGGEEFVVLMPGTPPEAARQRIDRMRRRIAGSAVECDGRMLSVTVSAGIATVVGAPHPSRLFHAADSALYSAKRLGRNRVEVAGYPGGQPSRV